MTEPRRTHAGWLVAVIASIVMVLHPLAVFAESADGAATATATVEVAETEAAQATATEVEPVAPSETPTATASVEPSEVATETAIATEPPTETATFAPAEGEAPATETAEATATESAGVGKTSRVSTAQTVNLAAMTSCSPGPNGSLVTPNEYITFSCTAEKTPFKMFVNGISTGWTWSHTYTAGATPSTWTDQFNVSTEASGSQAVIYVFLRPTSDAAVGSIGTLNITLERTNGEDLGLFSLTGVRKPEAAHFQSSCSPNSVTVPTSGIGTITCTIEDIDLAQDAVVAVSNLQISAPAGWTVAPSATSGTLTGSTPFTVTLSLTPVCGAPVAAQAPNVTVSATLTFMSALPIAAPTASFTANHSATSTVSTGIADSDLNWTRSYAFASQVVNGSMSYQVTASGCAGWNIQVSATEFAYSGSASGAPISSSNIAIVPGPVTVLTGSALNLNPGSAGALASPITVLSAAESYGVGTYEQTLGVSVTIPGATRVGTYTATITITAASGP